jgi:hypothetical protein
MSLFFLLILLLLRGQFLSFKVELRLPFLGMQLLLANLIFALFLIELVLLDNVGYLQRLGK